MRVIIPLLAFWLLYSPCALASGFFQAGFRTVGDWSEEPPMRLDIGIWYPAARQPKDLSYPPWTISAAPNARPAQGRFPLLLLSHATPEDRFSHHNLASALAREGYVVAAPGHSQDCMDNMNDLFTWNQLDRRVKEMARAIDLTLAQKDLVPIMDPGRIGVIGFGSGGAAALLLGGAMPTCAGWPAWRRAAGSADVYCSAFARDRIDALCGNFPLRRSLADPRIKAVAAIAPGYGMLFDASSFHTFYPPLLLASAGRDEFNAAERHCLPLARLLGKKARFLDLPAANSAALMAPCPPALAAELPEMCESVTPQQRESLASELQDALLAFFGHYLLNTKNLPAIPAPPQPAPEKTGAPPAAESSR